MWLPILTFFAQGFEHSVVNMFVIPAGMLLGARVSLGDWWMWNQIPVTLGNIAGGMLFTGLALHLTHAKVPAGGAGPPPAAGVRPERPAGRSGRASPPPSPRWGGRRAWSLAAAPRPA